MANSSPKILWAPKNIELNSLSSFVRVFNFVFNLDWKEVPNYHFAFGKVERCDITGVLLLYKLLEYSVARRCFRSPTHDIAYNDFLKSCISEFGFLELIKSLMNNPNDVDLKFYKKLKISSDKKVLIAPIALIRSDAFHSLEVIKRQYVPIITDFYKDEGVQQMILEVFTEVMHNFWAHATSDNKSIIVGYGTRHYFDVVCCDNGDGIDGTMRKRFMNKDPKVLVKRAMENEVTSKENTSHMGFGLWFINEVVTKTRGTLTIVSNNVLFRNSYGKISVSNCPSWKGCILSTKLPLLHPVSIKDIEPDKFQNVNVNFI